MRELLSRLEKCPAATIWEKGMFATDQIKDIAGKRGVDLTLRKKTDLFD